jgi:hypothetical protein
LVHVIGGGGPAATTVAEEGPFASVTDQVPCVSPSIATSRASAPSTSSHTPPCSTHTKPVTTTWPGAVTEATAGPTVSQLEVVVRTACTNAVCPSTNEHAPALSAAARGSSVQ